ncbi:MAG: hypothetical protein WCP39_00795 [Chlamydiota bacterium]
MIDKISPTPPPSNVPHFGDSSSTDESPITWNPFGFSSDTFAGMTMTKEVIEALTLGIIMDAVQQMKKERDASKKHQAEAKRNLEG